MSYWPETEKYRCVVVTEKQDKQNIYYLYRVTSSHDHVI